MDREKLDAGLAILRREARGRRRRTWRVYARLMERAEEHVLACGGNWGEMREQIARELAELLGL